VLIDKIDFAKCHPFKDFGCGFYLTDTMEHARNMAFRRAKRGGGEERVSVFDFDYEGALQNLKIKIFDKPSEEWANFVMMNRSENIAHPAHDYDIVIGPIADDSVVMSFRLYQEKYISISELVKRLEYKELSTQYFFHNANAVKYLKLIV
jgi:hypothetical protein